MIAPVSKFLALSRTPLVELTELAALLPTP